MDLKSKIRVVEDFPKKKISFKDITTLLDDPETYQATLDQMEEKIKDLDFDYIAGVESRGFILGAPLADRLKKAFVPIRKPGKLPADVERVSYDLEYGSNELQIHKDALKPGAKVVIVDDLIATGGSASASAKLIEKLGGEVVALEFLIELTGLNPREVLEGYKVISLVEYDH